MIIGLGIGLRMSQVSGKAPGPGPDPVPTITVTGSPTITVFERDGISHTQLLWRASGTMYVSEAVSGAKWALAGGGGGRAIYTNGSPGGGGASMPIIGEGVLPAGVHVLNIGAGGAVKPQGGDGNDGSASTWLIDGAVFAMSLGGGGGGGDTLANGRDGGNGGGGQGAISLNKINTEGGAGTHRGGSGFVAVVPPVDAALDAAGGGGGGAGGNGGDGAKMRGGIGGPGVQIDWTDAQFWICGGGGGSSSSIGIQGTGGIGGGTDGRENSPSDAATNGSGSGGANISTQYAGAGGDGLHVLVFPTANAKVRQ